MHVGLHNKINKNAGDTVLFDVTRRLFESFLGEIEWTLHQAWEPFHAVEANKHDGVVVGGGGLILKDQAGAGNSVSGWQFNCSMGDLAQTKVPLIVFGVGWNQFRGQEDFQPPFYDHIKAVVAKSAFFGLREHSVVSGHITDNPSKVSYQPCPTACIWQLYPEYRSNAYCRTLAINVAGDRLEYRYEDDEHRRRIYKAIIDFSGHCADKGWVRHVYLHKDVDEDIVDLFRANTDFEWYLNRLYERDTEDIIRAYSATGLTLGMRSHSQLIPFGVRRNFISLISHNKLRYFLVDNNLMGLGVDVNDPNVFEQLKQAEEMRGHALAHIIQRQSQAWVTTCQNMITIEHILKGR